MPDTCTRQRGSVWTSCACDDCRTVRLRNAKLYRNGRLPVVDQRARAVTRFHKWQARGYSSRAVSDMTGLSERTVQAMFQGRSDPAKMMHRTAQRILDAPDVPTGRGWVPSIGCVRRLQALTVMGWSMQALSQRCDLDESTLAALRSETHRTTRPRFARIVSDLYDEVWDTPGPGRHAATRARNRGWAPPLAWDDDTIDDPTAQPDTGQREYVRNGGEGMPQHVLVETVEDLLDMDAAVASVAVAERLGVTWEAVRRGLSRAGRTDLSDRLTLNNDLRNGHTNGRRSA